MFKVLRDKDEVVKELNTNESVIVFDVKDTDEYGMKGTPAKTSFRKLEGYYSQLETRIYDDEERITFGSYGCCIHSGFSKRDVEDLIKLNHSVIIEPSQKIVVVFKSEHKVVVCTIEVEEEKKLNCTTVMKTEKIPRAMLNAIIEGLN